MITFDNGARVAETTDEHGLYQAEASTIGLAPGSWPVEIVATLAARGLEPEMPITFYRHPLAQLSDGEVVSWTYRTTLGSMILEVWND